MVKIKIILPLAKPIHKKKSPYRDIFDKKNPASIKEKISDRSEFAKMPEIKLITLKSKHTIFHRSRLKIQSIQSKFKSIEFDNNIRGRTNK